MTKILFEAIGEIAPSTAATAEHEVHLAAGEEYIVVLVTTSTRDFDGALAATLVDPSGAPVTTVVAVAGDGGTTRLFATIATGSHRLRVSPVDDHHRDGSPTIPPSVGYTVAIAAPTLPAEP